MWERALPLCQPVLSLLCRLTLTHTDCKAWAHFLATGEQDLTGFEEEADEEDEEDEVDDGKEIEDEGAAAEEELVAAKDRAEAEAAAEDEYGEEDGDARMVEDEGVDLLLNLDGQRDMSRPDG